MCTAHQGWSGNGGEPSLRCEIIQQVITFNLVVLYFLQSNYIRIHLLQNVYGAVRFKVSVSADTTMYIVGG
jgi:hypothetical protein